MKVLTVDWIIDEFCKGVMNRGLNFFNMTDVVAGQMLFLLLVRVLLLYCEVLNKIKPTQTEGSTFYEPVTVVEEGKVNGFPGLCILIWQRLRWRQPLRISLLGATPSTPDQVHRLFNEQLKSYSHESNTSYTSLTPLPSSLLFAFLRAH